MKPFIGGREAWMHTSVVEVFWKAKEEGRRNKEERATVQRKRGRERNTQSIGIGGATAYKKVTC